MNKLSLALALPLLTTLSYASSPKLLAEENLFDGGVKRETRADGATCLKLKNGEMCWGGAKAEVGQATLAEGRLNSPAPTTRDGERMEQDRKLGVVVSVPKQESAEDREARIAACVAEKTRDGILVGHVARALCAEARDTVQATACYKGSFANGIVDTASALSLCKDSTDAAKTLTCFTSEMRSGKSPSQRPAIDTCSAKG